MRGNLSGPLDLLNDLIASVRRVHDSFHLPVHMTRQHRETDRIRADSFVLLDHQAEGVVHP
jgi:hypothetical protein